MRVAIIFAMLFGVVKLCRAEECGSENPEAFEEFLPRFSSEKPFAIERTRLPLRVVKWSDGVDIDGRKITEPQRYDLSLSEYWHWPTLGEYIETNGLQSHVSKTSTLAQRLDLSRDDIKQTATYYFESKEGCWFMTRYEGRAQSL